MMYAINVLLVLQVFAIIVQMANINLLLITLALMHAQKDITQMMIVNFVKNAMILVYNVMGLMHKIAQLARLLKHNNFYSFQCVSLAAPEAIIHHKLLINALFAQLRQIVLLAN